MYAEKWDLFDNIGQVLLFLICMAREPPRFGQSDVSCLDANKFRELFYLIFMSGHPSSLAITRCSEVITVIENLKEEKDSFLVFDQKKRHTFLEACRHEECIQLLPYSPCVNVIIISNYIMCIIRVRVIFICSSICRCSFNQVFETIQTIWEKQLKNNLAKLRVEKVLAQLTNPRDQLSHHIGFPCWCWPPCRPPRCYLDALCGLRDADRMEIRKRDERTTARLTGVGARDTYVS